MRSLFQVILLFLILLTATTSPAQAGEDMEMTEQMKGKANLTYIHTKIFTGVCVSCHDSSDKPGGLDLRTVESSYRSLVEDESSQPVKAQNKVAFESRWNRVHKGDPSLSFLVRKIEDPGLGEGSPMPSTAKILHPYYMAIIKEWIRNGAKKD